LSSSSSVVTRYRTRSRRPEGLASVTRKPVALPYIIIIFTYIPRTPLQSIIILYYFNTLHIIIVIDRRARARPSSWTRGKRLRPGFNHPSGLLEYQGRRRLHAAKRHCIMVYNGLSTHYPYRRAEHGGTHPLHKSLDDAAHTFISYCVCIYLGIMFGTLYKRRTARFFLFFCLLVCRINFFFTPWPEIQRRDKQAARRVYILYLLFFFFYVCVRQLRAAETQFIIIIFFQPTPIPTMFKSSANADEDFFALFLCKAFSPRQAYRRTTHFTLLLKISRAHWLYILFSRPCKMLYRIILYYYYYYYRHPTMPRDENLNLTNCDGCVTLI